LTSSRKNNKDYLMITNTPEFFWPVEDEAGTWEALEPWPRPLAGVRIEGQHLCLEYRKPYLESRGSLELASANFGTLTEFADLAQGDCVADGRLLRFASRYGGLGLCKQHGWPLAHTRPHCPTDRTRGRLGDSYREPIQSWRAFSSYASTILFVLVGRPGAERDAMLELLRKGGDEDANHAIVRWLMGGELKLRFLNRPSRLTLYGAPPLWTAIGLQLATLAAGAKGVILCSACGRLDSVKHPHRNGNRRSYCSKCRERGRKRHAVADLRERRRRAFELREEGKTIAQIGVELGIEQSRVKRYLAKGE
jgi:hypothetical protein